MSIAFFISAHALADQFSRLYTAIWNESDLFLIHLDAASSDEFARQVHEVARGRPNVHFLTPASITWGGWSQVEMNLRAIRFLCRRNESWTHFVNLSGQDYPLKPIEAFQEFLQQHCETNFIQCMPINSQPFHIRRRLHWYCIESNKRLRRLPIPNLRAMSAPIDWYGGTWCNLTRAFCEWLTITEQVKLFRRALQNTKSPDEFFFQSIIHRSPFSGTIDTDPRRYIRFDPGSPHPRTLVHSDLDQLLASSAFFARKFDSRVDPKILHEMEQRVTSKNYKPGDARLCEAGQPAFSKWDSDFQRVDRDVAPRALKQPMTTLLPDKPSHCSIFLRERG